MPVSVENEPTVKVRNPDDGTNLKVRVSNWPQEMQAPDAEYGWGPEDRALLREVRDSVVQSRRNSILGTGLGLFAVAGLLVLALPRV